MRTCLRCSRPIDPNNLSMEQRIIDDQDFCRACFTYLVSEADLPVEFPARMMSLT